MEKSAGGEGGEWEDARDAAAEMAWNGAAIWHACTWRARGREDETVEEDKQEKVQVGSKREEEEEEEEEERRR
jgi:hypothetical protein